MKSNVSHRRIYHHLDRFILRSIYELIFK